MSMHDTPQEPRFQPGGTFLGEGLFVKVTLLVMGLLLFVGLQMVLFSTQSKPQPPAPVASVESKPAPPRKPELFPGKQIPNNPKMGREAIRGRVLLEDGQPAVNVLVAADERPLDPAQLLGPLSANRWGARTNPDGVFLLENLKPLSYVVTAVTANSHAIATVTLTENGPIAEPVLTLLPSVQAQIHPVNAAGKPVTKQVKVYPIEHAGDAPGDVPPYQYLPQTQAQKNAFHFTHLPGGSWRFLVTAPGLTPVLTEETPLDGKPLEVPLGARAVLRGQVVSAATGKPLSRARILAVETRYHVERYETTADNFGRFTFDAVRPATYTLRLCSKQAAFATPLETLEATPESTVEHLLNAVPAARMRGRVLLAGNQGYVSDAVVTMRLVATPEFTVTAKTDSAGFYTLYGLTAGDYTPHIALPPGIALTGILPTPITVQLPGPLTGPEIIAVEMPPLAGVVYDANEIPINNANVYFAPEGVTEPIAACHTGETGAFTCQAAPPGATITLWAEKSGLETPRLGPLTITPTGEKTLALHFPPQQ